MSAYGKVETAENGQPRLRFERTLSHPPEKVWRAITEPEHLARWFPTTIDGERAAGAHLLFEFPEGQAPAFDGEMLEFDPPRVMELRWGPDTLRLELRPVEQGTVLVLLDTLEEIGKAARDAAGWHTCLDALTEQLDDTPRSRSGALTWNDVHPTYVTEFGAVAARIGPPEGMV
jgi:uncharacterized protein YndB with AHSA1/START domain